jgi:hypothetical protein
MKLMEKTKKKKYEYDWHNSTEVYAAFSLLLAKKVKDGLSLKDLSICIKKAKSTISEQFYPLKQREILKENITGKEFLIYFNDDYFNSKSGKQKFPCLSLLNTDIRLSILKGSLSFAHAEIAAGKILVLLKGNKKKDIKVICNFYDFMYLGKMYGEAVDPYENFIKN